MTSHREIENLLDEQGVRIGKAAASPKRLEWIELLYRRETSVDALASRRI